MVKEDFYKSAAEEDNVSLMPGPILKELRF